ncbi:MAG: helix-turn-helix domain-containing protein [Bacteroidetes bacterium]|nr:helix-turn-helix domain-containing protein [Bacteroidota bacterium]
MTKQEKARKHSSALVHELLHEITPLEMKQTQVKMELAARIDDLIKNKGWNKSQFAEMLGKNPSEITKWLSGTHNFTLDTLTEIASILNLELSHLFGKEPVSLVHQKEFVVKTTGNASSAIKLSTPYDQLLNTFGNQVPLSQEESSEYKKAFDKSK